MDINRICISCMGDRGHGNVCPLCGSKQDLFPEPPHSLPPQSILKGKYLVGRVLGHGGFGVTYISWDLEQEKKVAVKEYLPDGLVTRIPGTTEVSLYTGEKVDNFAYGMEKFLEEARTIYKFNSHPNIIAVNDLFEENGTAYYTMEYVDGMDLKQYLEEHGGKLSFDAAMGIMLPVFDALKAVHDHGFIHRDISPDNIYVSKNMDVKLLDFGAARYAVGERSQNLSVILKMGFAPEEQYRSKGQQGPWTDVYAVGATIYRLITGHLPPESTERVIEDTIRRPSEFGITIPPHAEAALMKALAVRSKDRFQNMAEFKNAITGKAPVPQPRIVPMPLYSVRPANLPPVNPLSVRSAEASVTYAGFWKRLTAILIDGVCLSFVVGILYVMLPYGIFSLANILLYWLYFALLESSEKQGTLGKMAMGIKVTDLSGRRLSFGKATGRHFGKIVSGLILCIGYMMAGFTEKKQALHDMMAGTLVVTKQSVFTENPVIHSQWPASSPTVQEHNSVREYNRPVEPVRLMPCLYGVSGHFAGGHFPMGNDEVLLGRNHNRCQIVFPVDAPGISGIHCSVAYRPGENVFILKDLGSSCGTFLETGAKIADGQPVLLQQGGRFYLGSRDTMFEVRVG